LILSTIQAIPVYQARTSFFRIYQLLISIFALERS
jgi:hypothetical protein